MRLMTPESAGTPHIAIVGAGPRGISVIERIGALLASRVDRTPLTLHVIDSEQIGAGAVWRTDQTRTLCMNTLAGAVTLFTEPGATVRAPIRPGPTLYEWILLLRDDGHLIDPSHTATYLANPVDEQVKRTFAEEILSTRIDSNPSRALYGAYLTWCYQVALAGLPDFVTVHEHRARAFSVTDTGNGTDRISLSDGNLLTAHSTILAPGWIQPGPNDEERRLADAVTTNPELTWIRPGNPIDQDVEEIPEGGDVLVRGLGMGFFDLMVLVTINRGGRFTADPSSRYGIRYEASGREPHLLVTSGRGYPFLPKSEYLDLPPTSPLRRLRAVVTELSRPGISNSPVDVGTQVWPAIARDAHEAYYRALARVRPEVLHAPVDEIIDILDNTPVSPEIGPDLDDALAGLVEPDELFGLPKISAPLAGITGTPDELREYIGTGLLADLVDAREAYDSPTKEGLWAISSCRKPLAVLCQNGRATVESRSTIYAEIMALGQMVGSGPPYFRSLQLLALVDAGLITFIGSDPELTVADGAFTVTSPTTGNTPFRSTTLVDAWMHSPDIRHDPGSPASPDSEGIIASLDDRIRLFTWENTSNPRTPAMPTGSPEVDPVSRRVVHAAGDVDKRVHVIGVPTWAQMADTTISPMPGTNPLMLQETDAAAVSAVTVAMEATGR